MTSSPDAFPGLEALRWGVIEVDENGYRNIERTLHASWWCAVENINPLEGGRILGLVAILPAAIAGCRLRAGLADVAEAAREAAASPHWRGVWANGARMPWSPGVPHPDYVECMESKGHAVELVGPGCNQALSLIGAERRRQIEVEGWSPEHDDAEHGNGELAMAAACYALPHDDDEPTDPPEFWPWAESWWKPGDRVRELVKAGALIVAEIERLQRAAALKPEGRSDG